MAQSDIGGYISYSEANQPIKFSPLTSLFSKELSTSTALEGRMIDRYIIVLIGGAPVRLCITSFVFRDLFNDCCQDGKCENLKKCYKKCH